MRESGGRGWICTTGVLSTCSASRWIPCTSADDECGMLLKIESSEKGIGERKGLELYRERYATHNDFA